MTFLKKVEIVISQQAQQEFYKKSNKQMDPIKKKLRDFGPLANQVNMDNYNVNELTLYVSYSVWDGKVIMNRKELEWRDMD
jgi:hypothetical protein